MPMLLMPVVLLLLCARDASSLGASELLKAENNVPMNVLNDDSGTASWGVLSGPTTGSGTASVQFQYNPAFKTSVAFFLTFAGLAANSTDVQVYCCTAVPGTGTAGPATAWHFGIGFTEFRNSYPAYMAQGGSPGQFDPTFFIANGNSTAGAMAAFRDGVLAGKAYVVVSTGNLATSISGFLEFGPDICTLANTNLTAQVGTPAFISRSWYLIDSCYVYMVAPPGYAVKVTFLATDLGTTGNPLLQDGDFGDPYVYSGNIPITGAFGSTQPVGYSSGNLMRMVFNGFQAATFPQGNLGFWAMFEAVPIPNASSAIVAANADICAVNNMALLATPGQVATLHGVAVGSAGRNTPTSCGVWIYAPPSRLVQVTVMSVNFTFTFTLDSVLEIMLGPIPMYSA